MLIDGFKYDLRIYVAITSVNPLRVYVYDEGICWFATEKYDTKNLENVFNKNMQDLFNLPYYNHFYNSKNT